MKRSLTIGCVLLVGGGVTHCGGNAQLSSAGEEQGGTSAAAGTETGFICLPPCVFEVAGDGGAGGDGGQAGSSDEPLVGAPQGGFFIGIPK